MVLCVSVQLYVIRVTCRDRSRYIIRRRYRQFDEMQKHLEQRFPVEAGEFSQKERILPNLPGKAALATSQLGVFFPVGILSSLC